MSYFSFSDQSCYEKIEVILNGPTFSMYGY